MAKRKKDGPTQVSAITHADDRTNIPTGELSEFVADDERQPTWVTYPRDPSVSPQLVWVGKEEQDAEDLAVAAPPIYIQEKLHPQVIIENLRRQVTQNGQHEELTLFDDFRDDLPFEDKVDFYAHQQGWTNRLILGDSLNVMASLAEKERLRGKVQMIYIDPPYGIKFGSNWQVSTRDRNVHDGRDTDVVRQPEQVKAFRDTWELGIHSYLAYLRDRLIVARDLLTETGSVFVQIGDENVHLVRNLLDEVFGPQCRIVDLLVKKKGSQRSSYMDPVNDYILWYSKSPRGGSAGQRPKIRQLFEPREIDSDTLAEFNRVELPDGSVHPVRALPLPDGSGEVFDYRSAPARLQVDYPGARLFRPWPITNGGHRPNQRDPIELEGRTFHPPKGRSWSHTSRSLDGEIPGMERVRLAGRLVASGRSLDFKRYLDDFPFKSVSNWWDGLGGASGQVYVVQTNTEIVKRCILMSTDPGDLVLDPTCGSGSTAVAAEQWGRRWITIDTSRVAIALARTRIMASRFPYYVLADSREGRQVAASRRGLPAVMDQGQHVEGDVRKGFIYRTASHVTSGAIANNPDIGPDMPAEATDDIVRRHAPEEILVDRPVEDRQRVRVAGPFTVESLSPHRLLTPEAEEPESVVAAQQDPDQVDFVTVILENLEKAGVKTTTKGEEIDFDRLETYAGHYLQAEGSYTDASGEARRVAVAIGPEHGTVGQTLVREAAKEALKGLGFDVLVVCGFAFDARAGEAAKEFAASSGDNVRLAAEETRLGKLPVLLTRMNPDLSMGDTLLKKTGAGNLFMVFGEPDVVVKEQDDQITIEVLGVDVYDPTTGEVRSDSTDDIACWFIDTDYDGESFFVRHAYFTGADEPYDKLKRALRADIDPDTWESLYSTVSRPFPKPSTGRVAVKVINHYGDEVLKVYEV